MIAIFLDVMPYILVGIKVVVGYVTSTFRSEEHHLPLKVPPKCSVYEPYFTSQKARVMSTSTAALVSGLFCLVFMEGEASQGCGRRSSIPRPCNYDRGVNLVAASGKARDFNGRH
jgi:hypothetical protein